MGSSNERDILVDDDDEEEAIAAIEENLPDVDEEDEMVS